MTSHNITSAKSLELLSRLKPADISMFHTTSDVTIIESEIEIEFFLENRIESKSIFWLVL